MQSENNFSARSGSHLALLFPGQGAQTVGMGRDLAEAVPAARELFAQADQRLGFALSTICFEGPAEELNRTALSQPATLVASLAALAALQEEEPDIPATARATAGLSLGEYTALVAAGALDFKDAVALVYRRGQLMQEACEQHPGGMVSILGLDANVVEAIVEEAKAAGTICAANYNSPGQIVVSGEVAAVDKAAQLATARGAKRALPLKVAGAFHSPLMASAAEAFASEVRSVTFRQPRIPVISNVTAEPITDPAAMPQLLVDQITRPVRWESSMRYLLDQGVTEVVEIGPGKVLTGLMRRIDSTVARRNVNALAVQA